VIPFYSLFDPDNAIGIIEWGMDSSSEFMTQFQIEGANAIWECLALWVDRLVRGSNIVIKDNTSEFNKACEQWESNLNDVSNSFRKVRYQVSDIQRAINQKSKAQSKIMNLE